MGTNESCFYLAYTHRPHAMGVASVVVTERVSATHPTPAPTARDAQAPTSAPKTVTSTSSALSVLSTSSNRTP